MNAAQHAADSERIAGELRGRLLTAHTCSSEARAIREALSRLEREDGQHRAARPCFSRAAAVVVAATVAITGCANLSAGDRARVGVAADAGSTVALLTLTTAVREANPAALPGLPITLAVISYAEKQPPAEGVPILHAVEAVRWGTFAAGVCAAATMGTCAVPALLTGGIVWAHGADERAFYATCPVHERLAGHALACKWSPT